VEGEFFYIVDYLWRKEHFSRFIVAKKQ